MQIDGKSVYAYIVLLADGPSALAFDTRPIGEVTFAWLEAWKLSAKRSTEANQQITRANILNQIAAKKVEEFGDDEDVSVEPPPVIAPELDEIFVMSGIPWRDGYGALSVVAENVKGIVSLDHDDLAGASTRHHTVNAAPAVEEKEAS